MSQNPTIIFVCTTCRRGDEAFEPAQGRSGYKFYQKMTELAQNDSRFIVQSVECLSSCSSGCNVTYAAKDKWSYGFGDLDLTQVDNALSVAKLHYQSSDGVIPWNERPDAIRRKSMSRMPAVF